MIHGQQSTKTFPEEWGVLLNQVVNEGNSFNWLGMLARQLRAHVAKVWSPSDGEEARFYLYSYLLDAKVWSPFVAWTRHGHHENISCISISSFFQIVVIGSNVTTKWPLHHPALQAYLWRGSTLHDMRRNGCDKRHHRLVCLTRWHLH